MKGAKISTYGGQTLNLGENTEVAFHAKSQKRYSVIEKWYAKQGDLTVQEKPSFKPPKPDPTIEERSGLTLAEIHRQVTEEITEDALFVKV